MKEILYKIKNLPPEINRTHFWSYDKEKTGLPAAIIIEQVLKYGTLEEIFTLFNLIDADEFMNIYRNTVRPVFEGKGSYLVYNSLSKEEQKTYEQKNLSRSPGLLKLFDLILPIMYKIKTQKID
ncbi:MAG: hypothetical protein EVJ46_08165 [Candidatus Acididesulfobacter guangdongensis]|uniref:Uncharacterized protein n=1 Tax=Acididesulfobacter guangdongensis TaxID=2597225 RepID=A0A519BFV3_ACIG2|nr:MAG: hypothetical protein EVJ46_08165 [Candidatus Acididesulfobacter guangdongensis]